jgi:hypothetical protein
VRKINLHRSVSIRDSPEISLVRELTELSSGFSNICRDLGEWVTEETGKVVSHSSHGSLLLTNLYKVFVGAPFRAFFLIFFLGFGCLAFVNNMTRRKPQGKKQKTGRKPDFIGKRLQLLQAFAPQWQQAVDADTKGDFYNKITRTAIKYWGYQDDYSKQQVVDDDDDEPMEFNMDCNEEDEDEDLTAEECERRQKIFGKLRTVSLTFNYLR